MKSNIPSDTSVRFTYSISNPVSLNDDPIIEHVYDMMYGHYKNEYEFHKENYNFFSPVLCTGYGGLFTLKFDMKKKLR